MAPTALKHQRLAIAAARKFRAAAFVFAVAANAVPAAAETLVVEAKPCDARIRVEADQVPLATVLERLSQAMGFRLVARAALTERVSQTLAGTPESVLKRLMQGRNLVMDTKVSTRCSGHEVLATVWVLPTGTDADRAAVAAPAPTTTEAATAQAPRAPRPPRPRGTRKRMSEAEWQQMKRDYMEGKVQADPKTGMPVPVEQSPPEPEVQP